MRALCAVYMGAKIKCSLIFVLATDACWLYFTHRIGEHFHVYLTMRFVFLFSIRDLKTAVGAWKGDGEGVLPSKKGT